MRGPLPGADAQHGGSRVKLGRHRAQHPHHLGRRRGSDGVEVLAGHRAVRAGSDGDGGWLDVAGPGGDGQRFPWRFHLVNEPTVSVYRPAVPRRR